MKHQINLVLGLQRWCYDIICLVLAGLYCFEVSAMFLPGKFFSCLMVLGSIGWNFKVVIHLFSWECCEQGFEDWGMWYLWHKR